MTLVLQGTAMVGELTLALALEAADAERIAVVGPNGAGKSSIIHLLAGLLALDTGRLEVAGKVWDEPHGHHWVPAADRRVGVVFQDHRLFQHLTVLDNVAFGLRCRGTPRRQADASAAAWLEQVELADRRNDHPGDLSGGQRQRTALARALAAEPEVLLLDEPFAAADAAVRPLLRSLVQSQPAPHVVMTTHDADDLRELADRVLVVDDGRLRVDDLHQPAAPFLRELMGA